MSVRNEVQQAFDLAGKGAGYVKHSGSWYKRLQETIAVLNLQKSQYGSQYYVNHGLWLLALGDATYPKDYACQIRARIGWLIPPEFHGRLALLLDLEKDIDGPTRLTELQVFIADAAEAFASFPTIESLVSQEGRAFRSKTMVTGGASELLKTIEAQSD